MQTTSEKRYKLVPVTDLDIMYIGGLHDQITYGEGDMLMETPLAIEVTITNPKTGRPLEIITCLKRNMASYKFRNRLLKVEDKSPLPEVPSEDAPTPG